MTRVRHFKFYSWTLVIHSEGCHVLYTSFGEFPLSPTLSLLPFCKSKSGCHVEVRLTDFPIQCTAWSPLKAKSIFICHSPQRPLRLYYYVCANMVICTWPHPQWQDRAPPSGARKKLATWSKSTNQSKFPLGCWKGFCSNCPVADSILCLQQWVLL